MDKYEILKESGYAVTVKIGIFTWSLIRDNPLVNNFYLSKLTVDLSQVEEPIDLVIPYKLPSGQIIDSLTSRCIDINYKFNSVTIDDGVGLCEGGLTLIRTKILNLPGSITKIPSKCFYGAKIDEINGLDNVSVIGPECFAYATMPSFTVPEKVTNIQNHAFKHSNIPQIILHDDIEQIGTGAFMSSYVEKVHWPKKCVEIPKLCFKCCYFLDEITGTESVQSIGEAAFVSCRRLSSFEWPKGCKSVPARCFQRCKSLTSVDISDVEKIGIHAFEKCLALESVDVSCACEIGAHAFEFSGITRFHWPDKCSDIPICCFAGSKLSQIDNLAGVLCIKPFAFHKTNLKKLDLSETNGLFLEKDSLASLSSSFVIFPYYLSEESYQQALA